MWNPESTGMESGIHSVESGIQDSLGLPYMGRIYIYHKFTRMDERIDNLGNIVEKIVVERSSKSHTNQTALDENNVVRQRRSVQQRATNLQSLAKRVIVIEKR